MIYYLYILFPEVIKIWKKIVTIDVSRIGILFQLNFSHLKALNNSPFVLWSAEGLWPRRREKVRDQSGFKGPSTREALRACPFVLAGFICWMLCSNWLSFHKWQFPTTRNSRNAFRVTMPLKRGKAALGCWGNTRKSCKSLTEKGVIYMYKLFECSSNIPRGLITL